jgi:hypothetical protein
MSPLGLTFFNSMLALLAITYLLLLDDPLKNENKDFLSLKYFLLDFQLNFLTEYQKPQVFVV